MEKKKVLIFTHNVENWGAERSTCSMAAYLRDCGYDVLFIIYKEGKIIELLNEVNLPYLVFNFPGWIYSDKKPPFRRYLSRIYWDYVKRKKLSIVLERMCFIPDIIYSNTIVFGFGMQMAKYYGIPHIQHVRENIDAFNFHFIWGYYRTLKMINKNSFNICFTCEAVRQRYIKDLDEKKTVVVHNGVIPVNIVPTKQWNGILKIIHIARFCQDKRVEDSLNAIKKLVLSGYTGLKLDVYGTGPDEYIYRKFINENGLQNYVEIKGFVPNIDYSPYHIGLMTSTFEAFARSTLDYMNNGLAVIASNAGGNIEQVENGVSGLLYNVSEYESLADALLILYKDRELLSRMGMNGRIRFVENFTQDRYVRKMESIFSKLK